jgi:hypothetical protein
MNREQNNKPQPESKAKDLSLESFSIEELEHRMELLLMSDTNCHCTVTPKPVLKQ